MIKRMIIMLALVGVVLGAVFGFEAFRDSMIKKFMASFATMPQTVATAKVEWQEWQPHLDAIGSLRAVKGADLSLELAGIVESITFNSGDDVVAGSPLLTLKSDDDVAKLQSLEATAELANITYERDDRQFKAQAISKATLDADAANLKSARAQVAQQKVLIEKKTLRAPFAGHLGLRAVDLGQYLTPGATVVTLQALDPIFVDFTMPQQTLADIKVGQPATLRVDTYPDKTFQGEISAISPKVDQASRNVQIRAVLHNPDHLLVPGMYAKVSINTGDPIRYLTVPHTAVTFNPYGETIFLVDDKGPDDKGQPHLVARQSFITTGQVRGDQVAVTKGVNAGDTVVIAGQMKLHNGTNLLVNNSVLPSNDANPAPADQ